MQPKVNTLKFSRKDIAFTLFPALIWIVMGAWIIPNFMDLKCMDLARCQIDQIFFLDQFSVHYGDRKADTLSHWVQNSSGVLVIFSLLVIHLIYKTLPLFFRDFLILLQATLWNGAINSVTRFSFARPRPFAYREPEAYGATANVYTSFYSGHTSFVALSLTVLVLFLEYYNFPRRTVILATLISAISMIMVGSLRVMAGVHFLTDVLVGAMMGILIAYGVFRLHQKT